MGTIFKEIIKLESPLLSFDIDRDNIFMLAGREIIKYSIIEEKVLMRKDFFSKLGLSRTIISDDKYLYCKDFTTLYIIDKQTLESLYSVKLGEYIDSDICGIEYDENYIYATIRNGPMAIISKDEGYKTEIHNLSNSSIWDIVEHNNQLYAGNVEGDLLVIEKDSLKTLNSVKASKKNLRSMYIHEDKVIIASQDKSIIYKDISTLETLKIKKNSHEKVFDIIGTWDQYLVTSCFVCGEMKIWDIKTLDLIKQLRIPKSLTGEMKIVGDVLYVGSRKTNKVSSICLKSLELFKENKLVYA